MKTTSPDVYDEEETKRPVYDFVKVIAQSVVYTDISHGNEYVDNPSPVPHKKDIWTKSDDADKKKKKKG